jgi:hypothetical protein
LWYFEAVHRLSNSSRIAVVVAACLGALCPSRAARGDGASADMAAARALGIEGMKLADSGKCEDAIDRLSRSEQLHHAPSVLERLGECQVATGKYVDGTESLQRVVREELPPNAPAVFVAAKARAQKALDAARPKVAKLVLTVTGAPRDALTLTVDGEPVSSAFFGVARPTDPGEHVVLASAPGFTPATRRVTLAPGGSESVALTLEVDPTSLATATPKAPVAEPPPSGGLGVRRVAGLSSLAVGAVGLAAGTVFGLMAVSKKTSLDGQCLSKVCPAGTQGAIDTAYAFGTVSTVGFIVGGVCAIGGAVLFLLPNRAPSPPSAITVHPVVGLGTLGVSGSF